MANPVKFELRGSKAMQRRMQSIARRFPDAAAAALYFEGELIMTAAKRWYVPVDDNPLRNSGVVHPAQRRGVKGDTIEVRLTFGGPAAPYALAVHEHPSPASPRSWKGKGVSEIHSVRTGKPWTISNQGRGPKYLERPLNAALDGMANRLSTALHLNRL